MDTKHKYALSDMDDGMIASLYDLAVNGTTFQNVPGEYAAFEIEKESVQQRAQEIQAWAANNSLGCGYMVMRYDDLAGWEYGNSGLVLIVKSSHVFTAKCFLNRRAKPSLRPIITAKLIDH